VGAARKECREEKGGVVDEGRGNPKTGESTGLASMTENSVVVAGIWAAVWGNITVDGTAIVLLCHGILKN